MNSNRRWIQSLLFAGLAALLALSAVSSRAGETITYIHWDALGSPVAATDESGNVVWRESYRPYGHRINNEAAAAPNSRWYTGHPQDPDTGLVYAGARYYDPVIGRLLGTDSVGVEEGNIQSFNRYAYGNNNPYAYVDPDGKNPDLLFATDPQAYMEYVMAPQLGVDANTAAGNRAIRHHMAREAGFELLGYAVGGVVGKVAGGISGRVLGPTVGGEASVATREASALSKVRVRTDVVLKGGRSGQNVKNLVGPANAAIRGGGRRAFITNERGQVILDVTKSRAKPVTPGRGFGPKRAPTQEELSILQRVLGDGS